jgi:hypothetical protein
MASNDGPRETKAPSIFHCRLIPPRPDFAFTMTEEERELMGRHADYLRGKLREGTMILAGPVADPGRPLGSADPACRERSRGEGGDRRRSGVELGAWFPLRDPAADQRDPVGR